MTTRFVGMKEFRQNMAAFAERAQRNREHLVVLRKNEPLFELRPFPKKIMTVEQLLAIVEKGRQEIKEGKGKILRSLKDLR